jgi:exoribonuclease II
MSAIKNNPMFILESPEHIVDDTYEDFLKMQKDFYNQNLELELEEQHVGSVLSRNSNWRQQETVFFNDLPF